MVVIRPASQRGHAVRPTSLLEILGITRTQQVIKIKGDSIPSFNYVSPEDSANEVVYHSINLSQSPYQEIQPKDEEWKGRAIV